MADNIAATPGVGVTLATDEIGGVHYQRVKLNFGVDGSRTEVSAVDPLPVTMTIGTAAAPLPVVTGLKTTEQLTRAVISASSSGDNTIIAAVSLQFIRIYALLFTVASPVAVTLKDTATSLSGAMTFGFGGGMHLEQQGEPHFITGAVNRAFIINLSAAVQISGVVWYTQGV